MICLQGVKENEKFLMTRSDNRTGFMKTGCDDWRFILIFVYFIVEDCATINYKILCNISPHIR